MTIARNDPNVQMFCWFTFRDSAGNPWKSGIENTDGTTKPAFAVFSALAHQIDGTAVTARAGRPLGPVMIYVPYLTFYNPVGVLVGVTYHVYDGTRLIQSGEPQSNVEPDGSVTFTPTLTPLKGHTYTISASVNDPNGNLQTRLISIETS